MTDAPTDRTPVLRYRRFGGGYRRDDVEAALSQLLVTVKTVESTLEALRARSAELESALRSAEDELAAYRAREVQLESAISRAETVLARVDAAGRD